MKTESTFSFSQPLFWRKWYEDICCVIAWVSFFFFLPAIFERKRSRGNRNEVRSIRKENKKSERENFNEVRGSFHENGLVTRSSGTFNATFFMAWENAEKVIEELCNKQFINLGHVRMRTKLYGNKVYYVGLNIMQGAFLVKWSIYGFLLALALN